MLNLSQLRDEVEANFVVHERQSFHIAYARIASGYNKDDIMVEDIHVNIVKSLIMFGRRGRITTSLGDEIKIDHLFRHVVFSSESDASSETHVLILSDPRLITLSMLKGIRGSSGFSRILPRY